MKFQSRLGVIRIFIKSPVFYGGWITGAFFANWRVVAIEDSIKFIARSWETFPPPACVDFNQTTYGSWYGNSKAAHCLFRVPIVKHFRYSCYFGNALSIFNPVSSIHLIARLRPRQLRSIGRSGVVHAGPSTPGVAILAVRLYPDPENDHFLP